MAMEVMRPLYSLYVGDLHPNVTERQLIDSFSRIPDFASAVVCKDGVTGRSLCYGYINFLRSEHALLAMEKMNGTLLNGQAIRIMWSQRDPEARKSGIGNVFVKNLDDSIDNLKFHEIFSKYGNILSCKVTTSEDGKSKGYGYVQFDSEESANNVIEKANGCMVEGKKIYVSHFTRKSNRLMATKYTNLYIKNFDRDISEEYLKERFSEYGEIINFVISKDSNGISKGFGFVNFENSDDAKRAEDAMNGQELGSKVLYVARAQKKAERQQILHLQLEERRKDRIQKYKGLNVYVKNIKDDVDDIQLQAYFSQCGTVTSTKIMQDDNGISKGFGFVCFSTPEEANQAVETLHGVMFHEKPLYVAIAQRKEERMAYLRHIFSQRVEGLLGSTAAGVNPSYPPLYYSHISQFHPGQKFMYPPFGLGPNGFAPPLGPSIQYPVPPMIPNSLRQYRPSRGRTNGHMRLHAGGQHIHYVPNYPQSSQFGSPHKNPSYQQRVRYTPNGPPREMNNDEFTNAKSSQGNEHNASSQELSSMLAAASPQERKRMLGERLYPLVEKHKHDLAGKITGMILEMDNTELLLLLESPEALAVKVKEAVQVLELSKAKADELETNHLDIPSPEVLAN